MIAPEYLRLSPDPDRFELMAEALGFPFLEALPYSCIPTFYDGGVVLEFLIERGWTPPAAKPGEDAS